MNNAATETDFLAVLFAGETRTAEEIADSMEAVRAAEAARIASHHATLAAVAAAKTANACPKCSGRGYLPQFQHRKGGECFACGATGVFTRHVA